MYTIKADGNTIYYSANPSKDITAARETKQVNSVDSLEYTVIKGTKAYDIVKPLKTVITAYDDDTLIFMGRATRNSIDWNNFKTVSCEGALGYLYDSIQRPHDFNNDSAYLALKNATDRAKYVLTYLLNVHNNQVEEYKQISPGNVTVIDTTEESDYSQDPNNTTDYYYMYQIDNSSGTSTSLTTNYETTYDAISNLLTGKLSGYLYLRYEGGVMFLDFLKEFLPSDGQIISFGSNLLDFSSSTDYSSICTGVLALGGNDSAGETAAKQMYTTASNLENKVTIKDVNNGSDILWYDTAVNLYGKIVRKVEWSTITDPATLMKKAAKYITDTQFNNLSLEAKAIDLHIIQNSQKPLRFMHLVRVVSKPHGMDRLMPISGMEIDFMNPANNSYTLGKTYSTASEQIRQNYNATNNLSSNVSNVESTVNHNATTS